MRKLILTFLLSLLLVTNGYSADESIDNLTNITNPASTDILYLLADPSGTPLNRKVTVGNLAKGMASTNLTDTSNIVYVSTIVTLAQGGLGVDMSAWDGLIRITGGSASNITDLSGLNTAISSSLISKESIATDNGVGLTTGDNFASISGNALTDTFNEYLSDINDAVSALAGGHDAVTLDANADTILSIDGSQVVGLDNQTANTVLRGGSPPAFGALVDDDIPNNITITLASTATSLAANGSNCTAGNYATGVDASGNSEGCTDATTEINSAISTHAGVATAHHTAPTSATFAENGSDELTGESLGTACAENQILKANATGGLDCAADAGGTEVNDLETDGANGIADTEIPIGTGAGTVNYVAISGDATVANTGALTIAADSVALGTDTTGNYVASATADQGLLLTGTEGASLGFIDCAANEVLKRNAGDTAWECSADSTGGSPTFTDIATGTNTTATMTVGTGAALTTSGSGTITATSSATATVATTVTITDEEVTNENNEIPFVDNAATPGNNGLASDSRFYYNPSTITVTAGAFSGSLDADDLSDGSTNAAITLTQESNFEDAYTHVGTDGSSHTFIDQSVISGSSPTFDGANITGVDSVGVVDSTDATAYLAIFDSATGDQQPKTDAGATYDATTGIISATGFSGPLTGAVTGNANTATNLAANPTDCGSNTWATTIAANGDLTCSAITYAGITAMSSTNFFSLISDATGSGGLVVKSTSPTIDTPLLTLENGNGAAPTANGRIKMDQTTELLQIGNGGGTNIYVPTTGFSGDATVNTSGAVTIAANAVALTTDTTGNYVQSVADAGNSTVTVTNGVAEGGAVTLDVVDLNCTDCIGDTEISTNAGTSLAADLEEETHASEHLENAADEILVEGLGTACSAGQVATSDGAGGLDCSSPTSLGIDDNATAEVIDLQDGPLIGIGAAATAEELEIYGAVPGLRLVDSDAVTEYGKITANAGNVKIYADEGDVQAGSSIVLNIDNSAKLTVDSSGDTTIVGDVSAATYSGAGVSTSIADPGVDTKVASEQAVREAIDAEKYTTTFTSADGRFSGDVITITHGLGATYPHYTIYNGSGVPIQIAISPVDTDSFTIDFSSITPISGTYQLRASL